MSVMNKDLIEALDNLHASVGDVSAASTLLDALFDHYHALYEAISHREASKKTPYHADYYAFLDWLALLLNLQPLSTHSFRVSSYFIADVESSLPKAEDSDLIERNDAAPRRQNKHSPEKFGERFAKHFQGFFVELLAQDANKTLKKYAERSKTETDGRSQVIENDTTNPQEPDTELSTANDQVGLSAIKQADLEEMMLIFNEIILLGNHANVWKLCLVNSITIAYREENPFAQPYNLNHALNFETLNLRIYEQLDQICTDPMLLNELIKFSLIVDSFIIEKAIYFKVVEIINRHKRFNQLNDLFYLEVPSIGNNPDRRVFISPITVFYIDRLSRLSFPGTFYLDTNNISMSFVQSLGLAYHRYPRDLGTWIAVGKYFLLMDGRVPGMMVNYLENIKTSFSLYSDRFEQIFKPNVKIAVAKDKLLSEDKTSKVFQRRQYSPFWRRVNDALDITHIPTSQKSTKREEIIQLITQLIDERSYLEPNEVLLAAFAIHLLKGDSNSKPKQQPMDPSSIRAILQNISHFLIGFAKENPITALTREERLSLYTSCMEMSSSYAHQSTINYNLVKFEKWLVKNYIDPHNKPLTAIDENDEFFLVSSKDMAYRVNAGMITLDEYAAIKEKVENNPKQSLLLLFGFRLGLRRTEATELKLSDYTLSDTDPQLSLKNNADRTLKTHNAQRTFILSEHMSEKEVEYLNDEVQSKRAQKPRGYLIKDDAKQDLSYDINDLMKQVREVTQNDRLKFHQLRHSKASLELLAIYEAQFGLQLGNLFFKKHPLTAQWLADARKRFTAFLPSRDHVNKSPYWLHEHMGHGALSTTLAHYVHVMDMISASFQVKLAYKVLTANFFNKTCQISESAYTKNTNQLIRYLNALSKKTVKENPTSPKRMCKKEIEGMIALNTYPCYQLHQYLLDEKKQAYLGDELKILVDQDDVKATIAAHHKLLFMEFARNDQETTLTLLKTIESVYEFSLHETRTSLWPQHFIQTLSAYESGLIVRYQQGNELTHLKMKLVNQYDLYCSDGERLTVLTDFIKKLALDYRLTLIAPKKDDEQVAKHVALSYWNKHLTKNVDAVEFREKLGKHGLIKITITNEQEKKLRPFYIIMAMLALYVYVTKFHYLI
jgi:integrase